MSISGERSMTWRHSVVALFTVPSLLTGCVVPPDDTATGTSSSSSSPSSGGAATGTTPTGIDCGQDPSSGVTLCSGSSVCPDNVLDATTFPNCGFRTTSPSFDLECVCDGNQLCPIGIAATCADIAALVAKRTVADICNQIGAGTCLEVGTGTTTTGTGGQTGTSSTCDKDCAADCANQPTCLEGCGC